MEEIKKMLEEIRPEFDFETSEDFIEDGFLDSFDVATLVSMLEEKFEIVIDALDVTPEYFVSEKKISELVMKNGGTI